MNYERALWSNATCAAPWAAVVTVLAVTAVVNKVVDLGSLRFDQAVPITGLTELHTVSSHLLARVAWAICALGSSLVAVAAIITCALVVVICLGDLDIRKRKVVGAGIATAAIALVASIKLAGVELLSEPEVTSQLREMTILRTHASFAVHTNGFFDKVSYLTFLSLVSAASATLTWQRNVARTAEVLNRRFEGLQWLLYVGAAALVLRALENYAFYRWPGVWLSPEMGKAVDRMALAVSTAHGAFYSAILVSLYVPSALIIRVRATLLANQETAGTGESPEAWLLRARLAASPFQELARLFLTVAPLLAGGPFAKLVSAFVS
jgi:hypothetical protein